MKLDKETSINQFVVEENIALGHRIKSFSIQVYTKDKWQTINSGTAIGNKYIFLAEKSIATKRVRLLIKEAIAEPEITGFSVFEVKTKNDL